ncbi:hypothetical protein HW132_23110 [Brasilonema sp. CT11]|nr:hypothetical protein [Brasilonema sp. CT11]
METTTPYAEFSAMQEVVVTWSIALSQHSHSSFVLNALWLTPRLTAIGEDLRSRCANASAYGGASTEARSVALCAIGGFPDRGIWRWKPSCSAGLTRHLVGQEILVRSAGSSWRLTPLFF